MSTGFLRLAGSFLIDSKKVSRRRDIRDTQKKFLKALARFANLFPNVDVETWKSDKNTQYVLVRPYSREYGRTKTFDGEGKAYFLQASPATSLTYAEILLKWRIQVDKYNQKV